MRGKRSKQYRKLMQQYGLTFGFREPYQVLVDAGMFEDAVVKFKMDFANMLGRTLHGETKPMITQCTIRHLYNLPTKKEGTNPSEEPTLTQADKTAILNVARTCEKRRCGHHDLEQPLSTLECFKSVIDPKSSSTNKHRYVIACQDEATRSWARGIRGIPSIYVKRSVMIMEPMAEVSVHVKESTERDKLRSGVKRKRGDSGAEAANTAVPQQGTEGTTSTPSAANEVTKKKKVKGPKGPNPLSVKRAKTRPQLTDTQTKTAGDDGEAEPKKKRKRRHGAGALEAREPNGHAVTVDGV